MLGIIDYGLGNISAFQNVYEQLSIPTKLIKKEKDFIGCNKLLLPGVGSFDFAMILLERTNLIDNLNYYVLEKKVPVLGICVGMQIMFASSEEGSKNGLGWIDGRIKKFNHQKEVNHLPLPHMGWNSIKFSEAESIFNNIDQQSEFYFLHSYIVEKEHEDITLSITNYSYEFLSSVKKNNIYGVQFHPEKSHISGIKLLRNFYKEVIC